MAVSRRTVTVLFADVADSTPLGERLDPESLRRVMSRFFAQMSDVLERHGGTVEKFIGDAVNVAKRLEEAARTGEILVGEPTRRLVENAVVLEPHDELSLKGKSDPHAAWNVLAVIEGASAYARRLDAPLIGREVELQSLRDAYADAVAKRTCRLFTVVGPAGMGKSRLAAELCSAVRDEATLLTGRCLPYGDGITFWPLVQIVGL